MIVSTYLAITCPTQTSLFLNNIWTSSPKIFTMKSLWTFYYIFGSYGFNFNSSFNKSIYDFNKIASKTHSAP